MATGLFSTAKIIIILALISAYSEAKQCTKGQMRCMTGNQCVSVSDVCRNGQQCTDRSDEDPEICSIWNGSSNACGDGKFRCVSQTCTEADVYCDSPCSKGDHKLCQLIKTGILLLETELTQELVSFLKVVVSNSEPEYTCPMLYTPVGTSCVSLFSITRIPWPEARQFCQSIKGDLLSTDFVNFVELTQYMRTSKLTNDYWTGGRFDLDTNAWSWAVNDNPMPLGTPYWATRFNSTCELRPPPQTNPSSDFPVALEGAPCLNYVQAPVKRQVGLCAAMTYQHYYYITEENCQENRSPLCVYIHERSTSVGNATDSNT